MLDHYRQHLPTVLDAQGDLAPPWEKFPTYERCTIGWRMGGGESWLCYWDVFLETLGPDYETRLAYLRRHRPAPASWADHVYDVLHPPGKRRRAPSQRTARKRRDALLKDGLLASDIAYYTWLSQQECVRWPWQLGLDSPQSAARWATRDFWFWSRQVEGLRRHRGDLQQRRGRRPVRRRLGRHRCRRHPVLRRPGPGLQRGVISPCPRFHSPA